MQNSKTGIAANKLDKDLLTNRTVTVIVNVLPTEDEQDAFVPKTGEQGKKRAQAG